MKRILNKSRSKWEKILLALCAFFWAGCDESTSNSGTLYGCPSDVCGDSSSSTDATSSAAANSSSSAVASSSSAVVSSFDLCSLEYTEAQLQTALENGYITNKAACDLGSIIALYGSPAMFDSIAKVNASTTLIYDEGVGCYRCPKDESSSSSTPSSSSVTPSSSSSSTSLEGCTLEIPEATLDEALREGSIYDKALCTLAEVATDYGVPYSSDASSVNSGSTLIYKEGVGCYRCPGEESSSSATQSSSSIPSSSSSSIPKSSSSRTTYEDCSLEITENQLDSAMNEGSIYDKTHCVLTEVATLYGISYPANPNASTNPLIYVEEDGCYRCPEATESSSSETSEEK